MTDPVKPPHSFLARRLPWSANMRDLGGLPARRGPTRWRAVVRSDSLEPFSVEDVQAMVDYGVHTVIYLRSQADHQLRPSPFLALGSPTLVPVPFTGLPDSAGPEFTTIKREYLLLAERFRSVAVTVFEAIVRSTGGVLIHCEYGKDRTGLVSALLLELAGVPRQIIGADHEFTAYCLKARFDDFLENGPGTRDERERDLANFLPTADSILSVLEQIDRDYRGTSNFLESAGVAPDMIERAIERLSPSTGGLHGS